MLTNPFAGRYEPNILPMMEALNPLGVDMAQRLRAAMDVPVERIEGYGKGAIVGSAGELEHGALWHVPGGYAMRELLGWKGDRAAYARGEGGGEDGPAGQCAVDRAVDEEGRRPRRDAGRADDAHQRRLRPQPLRRDRGRVPGAPRSDEMVFILAMSTGARVHARVGGLKAADIAKWDGLR